MVRSRMRLCATQRICERVWTATQRKSTHTVFSMHTLSTGRVDVVMRQGSNKCQSGRVQSNNPVWFDERKNPGAAQVADVGTCEWIVFAICTTMSFGSAIVAMEGWNQTWHQSAKKNKTKRLKQERKKTSIRRRYGPWVGKHACQARERDGECALNKYANNEHGCQQAQGPRR